MTEDASAAARAPMGEALVADPGAVIDLLLEALDAPGTPAGPYRPAPEPLTAEGTGLHPEQVFAALRDELPEDTAYVVESTSTNSAWWHQMDLRRQGSYYFPAAGGLGFGLPGAVGVAMAQPGRPVVGVIGDGSANYGITALWTAAQHRVPLTVVLLRNGTYGALRWFGGLLGVPDAPGLDIPGLDFTRIAEGYGVRAQHVGGAEGCAPCSPSDRTIPVSSRWTRRSPHPPERRLSRPGARSRRRARYPKIPKRGRR
ncbi:thiamine pyrophosphate-dependent enzyme [Streptomyces thinghirensis]|nr:thiamine pyrophosphate-dependent enzyme [Streptomyces thinghirensis]